MSRVTPATTRSALGGFLAMSLDAPDEALACLREAAQAVVCWLRGDRSALAGWRNAWQVQCTTWTGRDRA